MVRQTRRRRVAVDEKQIEADGEKKSLYAAIDIGSKLLLDVGVFSCCGTDPRRRSCIASPKSTTSQMPSFLLTQLGISPR
jgi:hypothetical protein